MLEKEMLVQLRLGDKKVFESLFKTWYERLCNYAFSILGNKDESEEIVQNLFVQIWEKRDTLEVHTSLKSYLYRSVHNHCLNLLKHYKVRQEHKEDYLFIAETTTFEPVHYLVGDELAKQIEMVVESLPTQCGKVFRLSRYEELTYAEIAEQLNTSVKTVENHMGKALKIVREALREYLPAILIFLFWKNN